MLEWNDKRKLTSAQLHAWITHAQIKTNRNLTLNSGKGVLIFKDEIFEISPRKVWL